MAAREHHQSDPFEALGDPNRREILRLLSIGDKPVQAIADAMTISRPAVSRHLRVLKDAGMVEEEAQGTRRIYHLQDQGLRAVEDYLQRVWGEATARFRLLAETPRSAMTTATDPLRIEFDVACSVEHAFAVWTSGISTWWPSDHTVSGAPDLQIILEGEVGGRIFERTPNGVEHDWGEVTGWDPPRALRYLWHLRRDRSDATEVEIRFLPAGEADTRIEIEHRGWERLGEAAEQWRNQNHAGWTSLIPHYRAALGPVTGQ